MNKVIRLEIGVEGPGLPGDSVELDIELSNQEYEQILSAYQRYFWDDDDLKDLFDDYLVDFKKKFIAMATPLAVSKWGDCAKEEKGARYYIFDPEERLEELKGTVSKSCYNEYASQLELFICDIKSLDIADDKYEDLSKLMSSFKQVKIKEGYVLDGFQAGLPRYDSSMYLHARKKEASDALT